MNNFFYSAPKATNKLAIVADVLDQIPAFDLMFELGPNGSVNNCGDSEVGAQWRTLVRENVIQNVGRPIEVDFMRNVAGGYTQEIDATELYIKTNADIDLNIWAETGVTGAPGAAVTFVMARSLHVKGKYTNVGLGGQIFIPEDGQFLNVTAVNTATDWAHTVTVKPYKADYAVNIRKGKKMLFNPTRIVGATSCPEASLQWMSNGYIRKITPLRSRGDYEVKMELDKAYQKVMQFAIIFDKQGKRIDSFELKAKIDMRWNMRFKENLDFFVGQKITNTDLLTNVVDAKFPGFEGYEPTLKYGGGFMWQYWKHQGFSLQGDLAPIMLRQDARKRSMEYNVLDGFPFRLMMENRASVDFSKYTGSCTFDTFKRMGADEADIKKLGVVSFNYHGCTLHFKGFDALSDQRALGNADYPYKAFMMPTMDLFDDTGRAVPPVEFFKPKGYDYFETEIDRRRIDGCEYWKGYATNSQMIAIHGADNHIAITPAA